MKKERERETVFICCLQPGLWLNQLIIPNHQQLETERGEEERNQRNQMGAQKIEKDRKKMLENKKSWNETRKMREESCAPQAITSCNRYQQTK